jgi:hypothetical protein
VLSPRYAGPKFRIDEPRDAILTTLQEHHGKFDWAIVLAYLPEAELRELAAGLPEVHAVIGGPTGQSIAPTRTGPVLLASATNKGKFVVKLSVPTPTEKSSIKGQSIELSEQFADDAAQAKNLADFRQQLADRDLTAADSGLVADAGRDVPDDYRFSGSASCATCHSEDADHWQKSGHAHAWETLSQRKAQMDSYCQQCHTTGFDLPGGFQSAKSTADRVSVGCESCHGPSHAHVQSSSVKTPFAAKDQCVRCHDHENSPKFNYASYWMKIQHGQHQ